MSDHRAAPLKYVDKTDAWDSICKKNEQIADLREQLATAQAAYLQFRDGYEAKLAKATAALEFIADGYDNQDVNHVDFRVKAYQAALDALGRDS